MSYIIKKWTSRTLNWVLILSQLSIYFEGEENLISPHLWFYI